jgi:hypothetical protein
LSGVERVRSRRSRRTVILAAYFVAAAAVAFIAVGCASGSEPSDQASHDQAAAGRADNEGGQKELPGTFPLGLTADEYTARVEKTQVLIAECMTEAGFEYVPASARDIDLAEHADRVQPGLTREEYKRYWGYGVSTRFDDLAKELELGRQNLRYIAGLSDADQVAYERTLYGDHSNASFAAAFGDEDFSSTGGCTRKSVEQVFTPDEIRGDFVNPKDVLIEKDKRVAKANADWVACMQRQGYSGFLDQDEVIEEFEERFEALTDDKEAPTLTGPKLGRLKQLQKEEIAAALADHACETKHVRPVVRKVEAEVYGRRISGRRDVQIPRNACPSCSRVPPPGAGAPRP